MAHAPQNLQNPCLLDENEQIPAKIWELLRRNENFRADVARLTKLGVEWFPSVEASSMDLIATYVASGLGIGVAVDVPKKPLPENVRALPLPGFPPLIIGAMWRGKSTPVNEAFLAEARARARELG